MIPQGGYTVPTEVTDCDIINPAVVEFEECAQGITENPSEIGGVLLIEPSAADPSLPASVPADLDDLALWEALIDNDDAATGGLWKHLFVVGNTNDPEPEQRTKSRGRVKYGDKTFELSFDIDDSTDANYEFMRKMEGQPHMFMAYYNENNLYGIMKVQITKASAPLNRGDDSYETFLFTATWEAKAHPPRVANPFTY